MDRRSFIKKAGISSLGIAGAPFVSTINKISGQRESSERPNIMVILADDMGISDIESYGGEVKTPNIDRLIPQGVKFTQFYNGARCCPTRASLLTGVYAQQAGMGLMENDMGIAGYRGHINHKSVTLAEVMKENGYSTYMTGKWHVTNETGRWWKGKPRTKLDWPLQRGFDRFYGTIIGACSYFDPISLVRDNEPEIPLKKDFYYTDEIASNMVDYIDDHFRSKNNDPFFSYVAFTAPHWPLQALEEDIAKHKGRYDAGWDQIRRQRLRRMRNIGLIKPEWKLSARDPRVPAWEETPHKDWQTRRMEVYAAQIERMDRGIGRILDRLEAHNQLDNTLIIFLSDNGGCAEILTEGWRGYPFIPYRTRDGRPVKLGDQADIWPGGPASYQSYGIGWANVSDTPFRLYKHYVHEGGISTPCIMHWPAGFSGQGEWRHYPSHIIDIMATCVDAANADYPKKYKGKNIQPMEGQSLLPICREDKNERTEPLFWEHQGNHAIRSGKWKLVQRHKHDWQLFDMEADRTELNDLSAQKPSIAADLKGQYKQWADRVGVLRWPPKKHKGEKF